MCHNSLTDKHLRIFMDQHLRIIMDQDKEKFKFCKKGVPMFIFKQLTGN